MEGTSTPAMETVETKMGNVLNRLRGLRNDAERIHGKIYGPRPKQISDKPPLAPSDHLHALLDDARRLISAIEEDLSHVVGGLGQFGEAETATERSAYR